ncbi:MAG: hypothetical protein AAGG01_18300, partial [Planctomycetota bacterium]
MPTPIAVCSSSPVSSPSQTEGRLRPSLGIALLATGSLSLGFASAPQAERPAENPPAEAERMALVQRIGTMLTERYVFPNVAEACAKRLLASATEGGLKDAVDDAALADALTGLLRDVAGDKHLLVRVRATPQGVTDSTKRFPLRESAERRDRGRRENFGFERVEHLEGNLGLMDLRSFASPRDGQALAVASMAFLENVDALIFDLRRNSGGSPGMVQFLSSHLFDEPTHLNSLYWREGDQTQEFWTLP